MKTLKPGILFLLCIIVFPTLKAQNFQWAHGLGSVLEDRGTAVSVDTAGNVYCTGIFSGTVDFDPGAGTFNLTSNGLADVFVLKLDASGQFVWAASFGGPMNDAGNAIYADSLGNVYLTGGFDGSVDFDPGAGTYMLTANGSTDIYVLKLDMNGGFNWARGWGDATVEYGNSIRTDAFGNVLLCGNFTGTVDFDPGAGVYTLSSWGSTDLFVEKLDAAGNFIWARTAGHTSGDRGNSLGVDAQGNVYTTGYFYGTVDFNPGPAVFSLVSAGSNDIFIQKLDANGAFVWAKSMGGGMYDNATCIQVDASGNVFTTGYFGDLADFDPGPAVSNLTSVGGDDIFVQKLDVNGNLLWVTSFGSATTDRAYSIAVNAQGEVYTTGYFSGTADFNPGAGIFNLTPQGTGDIFIQKLDATGNFLWAGAMGGIGDDKGYTIQCGASGHIYTAGAFSASVDFDPGAATFNLSSAGNLDLFVQKLNDCHSSFGTDVVNACGTYTWINGITYTSSNSTDTITISSVSGCDSVVTLNLTIQSVSNVSVTANGATLTANNTNASYQWLDCNNNFAVIPAATNQSYMASTNGSYAVELTENGCVDTSACASVNVLHIVPTGYTIDLVCYPVPTTGMMYISLTQELQNAVLSVSDNSGRVIYEKEFDLLKNTSLSPDTKPGVYFLHIRSGDRYHTSKVVVR